MCTAISFNAKNHYFGRTLDYEKRFGECITVAPRNFKLKFRNGESLSSHFAIIGTAVIEDGYPLFFDATNECGLSVAGLNFVGNAYYGGATDGSDFIAPYELIPYLLSKFKSVGECVEALKKINIADVPFKPELKNSQLHWMIADKDRCVVLECIREGMKIYENPVGVLTNNPPFYYQVMNLNNYMGLSRLEPENTFSEKLELKAYSRGMGAVGLPGDNSSASRFVRAAFTLKNAVIPTIEENEIGQFFHIIGSVEQVEGCVAVGDAFERTQYTSCCDTQKGIYYYKTYENSQIYAVDMRRERLDSDALISYEPIYREQINFIN